MDDLRELLAEAVADERPREHSPDLVRRSLRDHRRRQRLTAGFVGSLVAAGVIWMTVVGLTDRRAAPRPDVGSTGALDLSHLERLWSADVPASPFSGVLADDRNVYVGTTRGVIAYPKACRTDPCQPVWELHVTDDASELSPWQSVTFVAGDGVVVAMFDGRLVVASADCRRDGGVCAPLWIAEAPPGTNGYHSALVGNGVVLAALGQGESPKHHVEFVAFEVRCRSDGGSCDPTWHADGGVGTLYSPGTFVNGVFYQQVGLRMQGFAANCNSDGGSCRPDLVIKSEGSQTNETGSLYGPVLGDGEVIFVAGTGEVASYAEHCRADCRPLWVGPVADFLDVSPTSGGNIVTASDGSGVTAFPIGCRHDGGQCDPAWHAELNRYAPVAYADDRFVVAASHLRAPALYVIPTTCSSNCRPTWSLEDVGTIYGVASDGESLFAAVKGEILAYPLECQHPCQPIWRGDALGETWELILDGGLIAASRTGDDLEAGLTLTAFGVK
jgi:hypothetical protein